MGRGVTHRAHASVQYASKVGGGRVCSPDPAWMPFQPARWPNCASDKGGGGGGDLKLFSQRPLSQARPAEGLRFAE